MTKHTYSPPTSDPHIPDVRNCGCATCRELNELRAENARLTQDMGAWVHRQAELQAQIAWQERRFREAEGEWVARFEALETQNQRLRDEVETWHRIWNDVEMLAARVEALRDGTAQTC